MGDTYPREQEFLNALKGCDKNINILLNTMLDILEQNKDADIALPLSILVRDAQLKQGMVRTVTEYWQRWKDEHNKETKEEES
jgi:hypothetical protein